MKTYIFLLLCILPTNNLTDWKSTAPEIIDGFMGAYSLETEESIFDIYADKTYSFRHWGDVGCNRRIQDFGSWEKIEGNGYKLNSFVKIENMNCKKRRIFRSFKLIPKDSIAEVPSRIYGYRYLHQYSKKDLKGLNKQNL